MTKQYEITMIHSHRLDCVRLANKRMLAFLGRENDASQETRAGTESQEEEGSSEDETQSASSRR